MLGIARADSRVDVAMFDSAVREALNKTAPRRMAVLRPLKVVIENYPEGPGEELDAVNNPENPDAGSRKVRFTRETPFLRLRTLDGLPTMVAAFTTDIPSLTNWGEPLLLGPGSIHVAHTEGEYVEKAQLVEAVEIYCEMAKKLSS